MASPVLPLPTFDVVEICQEASERAGIEFRSGYSLTTARRSLELLSLEWANRGLNLWTVQWDVLPLDPLVSPTLLPPDTIDVLDVSLRQQPPVAAEALLCQTPPGALPVRPAHPSDAFLQQTYYPAGTLSAGTPPRYTDTPLVRMGSGDWAAVANKQTTGRPYQYYVNRLVQPVIYLNPPLSQQVYDSGIVSLHYSRLRYMQPIPPGGAGVPEMPLRFLNAMISGLAFHLAMKSRDPQARQQAPVLRELYERDFELAADEDRERISFFATPQGCGYRY